MRKKDWKEGSATEGYKENYHSFIDDDCPVITTVLLFVRQADVVPLYTQSYEALCTSGDSYARDR